MRRSLSFDVFASKLTAPKLPQRSQRQPIKWLQSVNCQIWKRSRHAVKISRASDRSVGHGVGGL